VDKGLGVDPIQNVVGIIGMFYIDKAPYIVTQVYKRNSLHSMP